MFRVPLEEFLRHLLQKKSKKKSEIFPLKKFRTTFFRKSKNPKKTMFFWNFSKTSRYFFLNVSRPLRRVFKTSFAKKIKKKIGNFSTQKISNNFFSKIEKTMFFGFFSKTTQDFFLSISRPLRRIFNAPFAPDFGVPGAKRRLYSCNFIFGNYKL